MGIALITVGEFFGVSRLASTSDYFAHTSYGPIARLIEHLGPGRAVLCDKPDRVAWHIYSPMWYTYGRRVPQYSLESSSDPGKLRVVNYPKQGIGAGSEGAGRRLPDCGQSKAGVGGRSLDTA